MSIIVFFITIFIKVFSHYLPLKNQGHSKDY